MNVDKLTENIVDQIKEAQIKLGYAKETVRLYYPAESLCTLMGVEPMDTKRLLDYLKETAVLSEIPLGELQFTAHKGRIEVRIPPEGAEYVHQKVPDPEFLTELIGFFGIFSHT